MSKKIIYLSIYLFINLNHSAQINLVPNPSFEDTVGTNCAFQMKIYSPFSTYFTKNWCSYQYMNPEFYNYCANSLSIFPYPNYSSIPQNCEGYQLPHTGNSYAGEALYLLDHLPDSVFYRELIVVKLKQPLKANTCYYGEFYYSFANVNSISINQLGMLFSQNTNTLVSYVVNNLTPQIALDTTQFLQDTLNWIKISGTFIAQGGEQFLTIGNFRDGAHLSKKFITTNFTTPCGLMGTERSVYVYIDDVSLFELPTPQLQNTYIVCPNSDSLVIGDTARIQTRYQWFANGVPIDTTSYIKIKPPASASSTIYTYVLQTTQCATTTQTVVVTYSNNCEPIVVVEPMIPNVFTPNADNINDVWEFGLGKGNTLNTLSVFNRWGNIVHLTSNMYNLSFVKWDGRTTSGEACSDGVYFYTLQYTDVNGDTHKKNGYVSLFR